MWLLFWGVVILLIIGSVNAVNQSKKMAKFSAIFPEILKPLLKEAFPMFDEIFTTSFCVLFWEETLAYAKEKTKEQDDLKALTKASKRYNDPNNKELYSDEMANLMTKHYPEAFHEFLLASELEQNKLTRAVALAMQHTMAALR